MSHCGCSRRVDWLGLFIFPPERNPDNRKSINSISPVHPCQRMLLEQRLLKAHSLLGSLANIEKGLEQATNLRKPSVQSSEPSVTDYSLFPTTTRFARRMPSQRELELRPFGRVHPDRLSYRSGNLRHSEWKRKTSNAGQMRALLGALCLPSGAPSLLDA